MIGRNDSCWCGSGKKWKKCHFPAESNKKEISQKSSNDILREQYFKRHHIILKNEEQIAGIRRSCQLASQILDEICNHAQIGVTTQYLDDIAAKLTREAGAISASFHYGHPPYPKNICTSINEVICHGIPDQNPLKEGDIVNIDYACILDGYYGDNSRMVTLGNVSPDKQLVVDVSYECLMRSIAILKPGIPVSAIGDAIESHATARGCSVVNQFVAHGVGLDYHEAPQIPHYRNNINIPLAPGMTFTIEPMINAGVREAEIDSKDKWTARTKDRKPSGQWEHTLLITETGHEVLTTWKR